MPSVAFGNVSLALELLTRQMQDTNMRQFKHCYAQAINELVLSPGTKDEGLDKAVWLDVIRWFALCQLMRMRSISYHREFVWELGDLFRLPALDPWCSYSLAYNLSCNACPAVTVSFGRIAKKPKEEISIPFVDRSFVYCQIKKSIPRKVAELCVVHDLSALKALVKREIKRVPPVRIWAAEKVFRNV